MVVRYRCESVTSVYVGLKYALHAAAGLVKKERGAGESGGGASASPPPKDPPGRPCGCAGDLIAWAIGKNEESADT